MRLDYNCSLRILSRPQWCNDIQNGVDSSVKKQYLRKSNPELLEESIEVYPIPNYGAVEMGYPRFHNKIDTTTSNFARFVHIWRQENGQWKMTRVISLH